MILVPKKGATVLITDLKVGRVIVIMMILTGCLHEETIVTVAVVRVEVTILGVSHPVAVNNLVHARFLVFLASRSALVKAIFTMFSQSTDVFKISKWSTTT